MSIPDQLVKFTLLLLSSLCAMSCNSSGNAQQTDGSVEQPMVEVPAGVFPYGATEEQFSQFFQATTVYFPGMEEDLRKQFVIPPEMVSLPSFHIDQFEVTNQAFYEFIEDTGYHPENDLDYLQHWNSSSRYPNWAAMFPVVWISQEDAQAYCEWKGKRLPTDQEWEKAARGAAGNLYPWGSDLPASETANYMSSQLEPYGNRPGDVSPYQVYDMAANASELTGSTLERDGRTLAIARGGSFRTQSREMRTFYRFFVDSTKRYDYLGFRCASDSP